MISTVSFVAFGVYMCFQSQKKAKLKPLEFNILKFFGVILVVGAALRGLLILFGEMPFNWL